MSRVSKSNASWVGTASVPSLADLEVTAATYTARVEADGGRVVDAAHLAATFAFIAAQGMSPNNLIYGARFGVREVNGKVNKVYAFNGNDLTWQDGNTFEQWRLDESGAYAVLKVETTAPGKSPGFMKAQALQTLMKPGHTTYIAGGAGIDTVAGDASEASLMGAYSPVVFSNAFRISCINNVGGVVRQQFNTPNGTFDPAVFAGGYTRTWYAGAYADGAGIAIFADTTARQCTAYCNGVITIGPSNLDSPGFAWAAGTYEPTTVQLQFVMGGTADLGVTIYRQNQQKVMEAWLVSGGTTANALALSQRMDTLYP
jgi:hypothetical protein